MKNLLLYFLATCYSFHSYSFDLKFDSLHKDSLDGIWVFTFKEKLYHSNGMYKEFTNIDTVEIRNLNVYFDEKKSVMKFKKTNNVKFYLFQVQFNSTKDTLIEVNKVKLINNNFIKKKIIVPSSFLSKFYHRSYNHALELELVYIFRRIE